MAGIGAVLGGFAGYWNAYLAARASTQSSSTLAIVGKGDAGPLSIVVLPFANLTGDPQQAYLADGITAAIAADLSRIRGAFIVSAVTAFAYKDKPVTVLQVGKELGVRFALRGDVQRSSDKFRITAQLADTTSGAQLWSESFDGNQADLFALQDQVTARVGNSIGREMVVAAVRDSQLRTSDPKAVDLLLQAKALELKPWSSKVHRGTQALYRQVLALEPNNVEAMVGLARSLAIEVGNGLIHEPTAEEKQIAEARDLALQAKALDPNIADIYVTLAVYARHHGDNEGALRALHTALSLDPKNLKHYHNLAIHYSLMGDPATAIALLTQGIRLDPRGLSKGNLLAMGESYFMLGNDDAAIDWLLKAQDADTNWGAPEAYLAMAYAHKGDHVRSRAAVAALLRIFPKFRLSDLVGPPPRARRACRLQEVLGNDTAASGAPGRIAGMS